MNIIYLFELQNNLIKKLNLFYIFLGEDFVLLEKNQDLILNFSYKKGFLEKIIINIEKNEDWKKVTFFCLNKKLFFKKTILIINVLIRKLNPILIQNIDQILSLINSDILIILKCNHLSRCIQKSRLLHKFHKNCSIVSCFTPYHLNFINWIKYEIQEKNINLEEKAFFLLCKYYEGNTLFINNILNLIWIIWPNIYITTKKIKKIIISFLDFSPSDWINSILEGQIEKSFYILHFFFKQKYNPLILVRALQTDLLQLIYIKREKKNRYK